MVVVQLPSPASTNSKVPHRYMKEALSVERRGPLTWPSCGWRHGESNPGPPACKSPTTNRVGLQSGLVYPLSDGATGTGVARADPFTIGRWRRRARLV